MKRLKAFFASLMILTIAGPAALTARGWAQTQDALIDGKVKALLQQMTLEEKVGEMTQITIDVVSRGKDGRDEPHSLDPKKLETAILKYHVGSILNVGPKGYSIDHWHEVISQIQDVATKKSRLKIPVLYGIDAIHGATYTDNATLFPQAIAMAATWNPELAAKEGEITAREVRASGIPWNFYPVMDVGRQPLWSRFWETYGEDVYLARALGTAYVKAHEAQGVATCLKHFVGYSAPLSGKDRTPAYLTERMLREYFLPPFEAGIEAGSMTVMVNSSEIDGIPGHSNDHLLKDVLKKELKFRGFSVSDWEDIKRLYTRDRVASSPEEAVRMAVMAGVDMSMVPHDFSFAEILVKLVKEGKVPVSRIDEAVERILRVKFKYGIFDHPYPDASLKSQLASADAQAANLAAAQEAITLLKNQSDVLPLSKSSKVLVAGPHANRLSSLNGGWTITWQGDDESLYPKNKKTILQAIQSKIGADRVIYAQSADEAAKRARDADAVVLVLGEKPYTETPGNINDLTLDPDQLSLAAEVAKAGKPVILVLVEGRPRVIHSIEPLMRGILLAYLPGMEGGQAVADILFGDVNPSGKLPFSYPRFVNSIIPYDHKPMEVFDGNVYNPLFPFGHGLSYTNFRYSHLKVDRPRVKKGESVKISVEIKNVGKVAGKEVVQLYLTDVVGSVSRPVRQLRGFRKILLQPGETRKVEFVLNPDDLSFIGRENTRIVEPGEFKVSVGGLQVSFALK